MSRQLPRCWPSIGLVVCCLSLLHGPSWAQDDASSSELTVREALPRIIYAENEAGELIPFVETFPWDAYDPLPPTEDAQDQPGCIATAFSLDVHTRDVYATAENRLTLQILKDGQHRIRIGMERCHFLSHPQIVNGVSDVTVFAQFNQDEQSHEIVVHGLEDQEVELAFTTEFPLKRIGNRTFFRMNLPRFPASKMTVHTEASDVTAGATDGMTVKRLAASPASDATKATAEAESARTSDDANAATESVAAESVAAEAEAAEAVADGGSDSESGADSDSATEPNAESVSEPIASDATMQPKAGTTFQVDGLLPRFEFWWQPRVATNDSGGAFAMNGDIEVTVNSLGKVSSVATLTATSYNKPVDGFVVQLPPNTRWVPQPSLLSEEYSLSIAERTGDREMLQVSFAQPSLEPPSVRIVVETQEGQEPGSEPTRHDLTGFHVLGALTQAGEVRVYSQGNWMLEFAKGDFARETNATTEADGRTFAYSRLDQLTMTVTMQSSQLIVEPVYIITLEETVIRLTAILRCTRRGSRQGDLSLEMGDWIFQSLRPGSDNVTIENPELLSPTNGRLDIPVLSAADRFDLTITATRPIENGLAVVSDELNESGKQADEVSQLTIDFPVPQDARLLHATLALQNERSLSVSAGFTTAYSEIRVPESIRSELETELRPLCFRMRASGRPAKFPILAARLARTTSVDITTEITNITPEKIHVRQQMLWQVRGVPLNNALLRVSKAVYDFGNLVVDVNGRPAVTSRVGNFDDLTGGDEVTIRVPIGSRDLGSFELVVNYDWSNRMGRRLETWEYLDSVALDLALPHKPTLGSASGRLLLRHLFRKPPPRVTGYDVALDSIGNESLNWVWEAPNESSDLAFADIPINVIPLTITRSATAEIQPEQFEELIDRAWVQTWCTETERMDRAVFRVQGGDRNLQLSIPDAAAKNITVWVDRKLTDFRNTDDGISIDLTPNRSSHVIELSYSQPRENRGLVQTTLPRIADAELIGQWYWHVVLPRNECMVAWPRRLTRAHHWDWTSLVPRRKSELTIAELEEWSGALPTRARVHSGSSEYLFGIMGEIDQLTVRTAPLPVYMISLTGLVLVAGSLLFYSNRPAVVLLLFGTAVMGAIYANPAFASVAGQFVVLGIGLVLLGQILAWLVNHSPSRLIAKRLTSSSTWIHRLDLPAEKPLSASNASEGGSSSFRSGLG